MSDFGFMIIQTLVTDIEPDMKVRAAMNEINAAQRLRYCSTNGDQGHDLIMQLVVLSWYERLAITHIPPRHPLIAGRRHCLRNLC